MASDFTVIYQALPAGMHEFHRVFNGDDMVGTVPVDIVHHGGKRGGLSASGRTGDKHKSFIEGTQFCAYRRQVQLFKGEDIRRNDTGDDPYAVQVTEYVYTETVACRQCVCKVGVIAVCKLFPVSFRHDLKSDLVDDVTLHGFCFGKDDLTVHTVCYRVITAHVQV